jgi:putative ubiquitin-RnfH superfamily antitoxin RatB of RatAB toxin-antitoxin module
MPRVTVLFSPAPRQVQEWRVDLPPGATARDALLASGWGQSVSQETLAAADVGIWGRRCALEQPVREGDRVEIYRGLLVDPKVARRERFRKQGARAAGLFAQRRPGAKQGY